MAVSAENDRIVITISREDKTILEELAKSDRRSLSNYVNNILMDHIKKEKERGQ